MEEKNRRFQACRVKRTTLNARAAAPTYATYGGQIALLKRALAA